MSLILSGTDGLSDVDGTAATPAIRGTDANTGIFFPAADTIAFSEGGVEAARFDSAGNLGLGVTPSAWDTVVPAFQIGGAGGYIAAQGSTEVLRIGSNNYYNSSAFRYVINGSASRYDQSGGAHSWHTAASGTAGNTISFTQAMTLDSSGNLVVGDTSATYRFNVRGATGENATLAGFTSGTNTGRGLTIGLSAGGTAVNDAFVVYNSTVAGGYAGHIWQAAGTERARIDPSGNLLVGTTSALGKITSSSSFNPDGGTWDTTAAVSTTGSFGGGIALIEGSAGYGLYCADSGNDFYIRGSNSLSTALTGGVYINDRATSWSAASDERLKTIIEPITDAINKVCQLRTVIGRYNNEAEGKRHPFLIAQDVQMVLPEAVSVADKQSEEQYLGVSYTDTIPLLVAAIKEQQALITQLTARITALEGA